MQGWTTPTWPGEADHPTRELIVTRPGRAARCQQRPERRSSNRPGRRRPPTDRRQQLGAGPVTADTRCRRISDPRHTRPPAFPNCHGPTSPPQRHGRDWPGEAHLRHRQRRTNSVPIQRGRPIELLNPRRPSTHRTRHVTVAHSTSTGTSASSDSTAAHLFGPYRARTSHLSHFHSRWSNETCANRYSVEQGADG